MKYINWLETEEGNYLSIGDKASWLNRIWIKVPLFIARLFADRRKI